MYIFKNLSFIELLQKIHEAPPIDNRVEIPNSALEKGVLIYSNSILTGFKELINLDDYTHFNENRSFYEKHDSNLYDLYDCDQRLRSIERMHSFHIVPYAPLIIIDFTTYKGSADMTVFAQILIEETVVWIDASKYRWYLVK
jgi:hypothetical protein